MNVDFIKTVDYLEYCNVKEILIIGFDNRWKTVACLSLMWHTILTGNNVQMVQLSQLNFNQLALIYSVIRKSVRNFQNWLRNNQDRHGRKKHINR
jgi:hypothetical protein